MTEMKRMCDDHFQQRKEDDDMISDLEGRIMKTREKREESKSIRQQKEDEKNAKLEMIKQQAIEQEAAKAASQKERQADILNGQKFEIKNLKNFNTKNLKQWPVAMTKKQLERDVVRSDALKDDQMYLVKKVNKIDAFIHHRHDRQQLTPREVH